MKEVEKEKEEGEMLKAESNGEDDGKKLPENGPTVTKSHFLLAPGLLTASSKLAHKIWSPKFMEMEEFLLNNKTVQAIENPMSVQEGIVGALQLL